MYAIMSGGVMIAMCDRPRYVKVNNNNVYVEASAEDAIALSINGNLYNINGRDAIPDAPEAVVVSMDGATVIFGHGMQIAEHAGAIITAEDAMCEMDAAMEERLIAVEDALCELDSAMNGGAENE